MRFGEFELIPQLRRLERNGAAIDLSSRAMDILCLLVERPGDVVSKREILARVWPDVVVDEGNVRFHVARLRRALGDGEDGARFIATIPGRGYCFVGMDRLSPNPGAPAPSQPASRRLPAPPPWVVGRDEAIAELTQRLDSQRFVSVVGAGGIGKTTVALMAAHAWAASRDDLVFFVDLGALSRDTPETVTEAFADALGLSAQAGGALGRVVDHLRTQSCLIVLDTCERAIDGAARLAEALFAEAPNVRVLATSREALRVEGEWVYRIQPLAAPKPDAGLRAEDALRYPAVQLFVRRAATHGGFELRDEDAPLVSAICRDLDGMALAIELAAGRVEAYGVRQVADLLSTEFALTWPGRRTAAPRQQTLNATLNWSHELLSAAERGVFRRLAVFVGAFSLQAALSVAADGEISPAAASDALSSLVAKSLLSAELDGARSRYRMGDATCAFARTRLAASSEEPAARLRHAQYYLRQLQGGESEDLAPSNDQDRAADICAALEWAFGPGGDSRLGVRLAAAASPLWLRQGWPVYCRRWAREALDDLARRSYPGDEMDEYVALASALAYTDGLTPEMRRDWEAAYDSARRDGRREHELTGLFVLWGHETRMARYQAAQALLDKADCLEAGGANAAQRAMADWMVGASAHFLGDHERARERLEHLVGEFTEAAGRPVLRPFGYDLESSAHRVLSLTHFVLGNFDQARAASDRAVAKARTLGHPLLIASAQVWRVFLHYFLDDDPREADSLTRSLIESARSDSVDFGLAMALAFRGLWLVRSGDVARGKAMTLEGLSLCSQKSYLRLHPLMQAELALQVARRRDPQAGPETGGELHEEADAETWCTPEILRIKGEIAELDGDRQAAETLYRQALALAERHGALAWRLRAANSLAGLWIAQDRTADADVALAPVFDQFKPGLQHPDLDLAARRLEACRRARDAA